MCDGVGESNSNEIKQIFIKQGVRVELLATYTPGENGKAERNWGKKNTNGEKLN